MALRSKVKALSSAAFLSREFSGEFVHGFIFSLGFSNEGLDFFVLIEQAGFFFEDEVGAHTAAGAKSLTPFSIFGAECMGIKVTAAGVTNFFQEFDKEEGLFPALLAKPPVLIEAGVVLVIQVNVEELAGIPGLGNRMHEVQAGHVFMGHFRIDTDHIRMVQCFNETEHGAGGGQVDVAAGFVRFGFEGKFISITLGKVVFTEEVQGFAEVF